MTVPGSNQLWCSDKMTISCWSGEIVVPVFVLDCCDREATTPVVEACPIDGAGIRQLRRQAVFARVGTKKPTEHVQSLSD